MTKAGHVDTDKQSAQRIIDDWATVQDKLNNRPDISALPQSAQDSFDDLYYIVDRLAAGLKYIYQKSE